METNYIDPGMIMSVVVALIILSVGVFAFFVTIQAMTKGVEEEQTGETLSRIKENGNSVFNILGVVLIIGAIMAILGLVYYFLGGDDDDRPKRVKKEKIYKSRKQEKEIDGWNI